MKVLFVAYLTFCFGTFILQLVTSEFFVICQNSGGACTSLVLDHTWNALTWPHYLLLT